MRSYWIKIFLGALVIFGVGMGMIALGKRGAAEVQSLKTTSDPINIPLAFLPFKLDGAKLGTLAGIRILRDRPDHVTSVEIKVKLADSVSPARLSRCILTLDNEYRINTTTSFVCRTAADTVGLALRSFGAVRVSGTDEAYPLLLSKAAIDAFTAFDSLQVNVSEADRQARRAERIQARAHRAQRVADSLAAVAKRLSDSLAAAAKGPPVVKGN